MLPKLRQITLKSDETINVSDGVTAIVGPNNAGKSLLLSELYRWLSMGPAGPPVPPTIVLRDIEVQPQSTQDVMAWLTERYAHREPGEYPTTGGYIAVPHFLLPGNAMMPDDQIQNYLNATGRFGPFNVIYSAYLAPGATRDTANAVGSFNTFTDQPQNPVQRLFNDRALEKHLSSLVSRAFGIPLTVNRYGGAQITVHLGSVSAPETLPPATREYLKEISALPQAQQQGDGVKAFVGMLLTITTTDYSLLIIDEPETFLHPPQAYLLGQILAEQHDRNTQVVVATHSADIIRGLTSARAASGSVSIVRLTRKETTNHVSQLSTSTMRELYDDPLIRYFNILDGLFFHGVVLCESESDCTYYRAVLEASAARHNGKPVPSVDLHFTYCGGKSRMAKAATALQDASVPVACVVDFDFLQNEHEFNAVVSACGGEPSSFRAWRNQIVSAIEVRNVGLRRDIARDDLARILSERTTDEVSPGELQRLRAVLKPRSGWGEAKLAGCNLLSGEARSSFDVLDASLRNIGIFIVRIGELERFHQEVAGNKADWLRTVLEGRLYQQTPEAREFVADIAANIVSRQSTASPRP